MRERTEWHIGFRVLSRDGIPDIAMTRHGVFLLLQVRLLVIEGLLELMEYLVADLVFVPDPY